jgi:prolyl-tRNA synthetase
VKLILDDTLTKTAHPNEQILSKLQPLTLEDQVTWGDFHDARAGDACPTPNCSGTLHQKQGLEVGHVFYLGTKYSKPLQAIFKNSADQTTLIEMGCYGIGVSRILPAIIETSHDASGIIWPASVAPYQGVIVPLDKKHERKNLDAAEQLYDQLAEAGFNGEIVLDDRVEETIGIRLYDTKFLGYPWAIVLGKSMASGKVEVQIRKTGQVFFFTPSEAVQFLTKQFLLPLKRNARL